MVAVHHQPLQPPTDLLIITPCSPHCSRLPPPAPPAGPPPGFDAANPAAAPAATPAAAVAAMGQDQKAASRQGWGRTLGELVVDMALSLDDCLGVIFRYLDCFQSYSLG